MTFVGLNTLERDDLLRKIAWQNSRIDKIERMLKGEQVGTARIADVAITNAKIADASITNAKIVDLTWDKAQGGTATLGGLNNVDGVLSILDNANVEKVVLDKDGVLVKGGKVVIQNDGDEVSIDSKGVVSSKNFVQSDSTNLFLNQGITGPSETDITGATLTFTITRTRLLLLMFSTSNCIIQSAGNIANFTIRLKVGTSDVARTINVNVVVGDNNYHTYSNFYTTPLVAGTYTIKLTGQLETITGNPTGQIYQFRLAYFLLGT